MKARKLLTCALLAVVGLTLVACGKKTSAPTTGGNGTTTQNQGTTTEGATTVAADKDYTIRIYSNSNSNERVDWLVSEAKKAGFKISIDNNSVISGDDKAVEAAAENKDGDILFGLNETRWNQVLKGEYTGLSIADWTPTWAEKVGGYTLGTNKAYGLVIQNVLMFYRTDAAGTNGTELKFNHWSDLVNCGYTWYRQNKVGGTTNTNINSALLYSYADPTSPAGGISVEGWKMLWKYCAEGKYGSSDDWKYGFTPCNKGDVQVSTYYSSSFYGQIGSAAATSENPIVAGENANWKLVEIADGTYYIAEYIGVIEKAGRTEAQTAQVKAFAEWFGSAEVQAAWGEEFDSYPCNADAAAELYDEVPEIYAIKNFALNKVEGTEMMYFEYVAAHITEWTNIQTNLGFFWKGDTAPATPDWDNLDWATLVQKKEA